jgi:hypothetical protein
MGANQSPGIGEEGGGKGGMWGTSTPSRVDESSSVSVKITPLVQSKAEREAQTFRINPTGALFQGGMPAEVRDIAGEYEKQTMSTVPRIFVEDRRAQQLLVTHVGGHYYVTPSPEFFSRHTGVCRVLGDKNVRSSDYHLQVGDFLRIGSVGLVVSEINTGSGDVRTITENDLAYLREDVAAIREDLFSKAEAATAAEEAAEKSPGRSPRVTQCYMCFDDEDTEENPLVAPCLCKGGTRYVHVECLQKWQCAAADDKVCVVSTAEEKNICKVCKSRYKTHVRVKDGRIVPLMVHQLPAPYICFLVVTRHETAEDLFNTQFQISFSDQRQIVIGRSRNCDMVLDYRTVSTQHATVTYRKGAFYFRDLSSSNGSMINVRRPMKLPYGQWVRLRFGRSIVALKAKRSWIRSKLSNGGSQRQLESQLSRSGSGVGVGVGPGGSPDDKQTRPAGMEEQMELLHRLSAVGSSPRLVHQGSRFPFTSFMSEGGIASPAGQSRPPTLDAQGRTLTVMSSLGGSGSDLEDSGGPRRKARPATMTSLGQGEPMLNSSTLFDAAFGGARGGGDDGRRHPSFRVLPSPIDEDSRLSQLSA